ncbi:MAG: DDE-type integrase/transposase/recombinase [Candidatus Micrarchaeota archaeon]
MDDREIRGLAIISKGDKPLFLDEEHFLVPSQSSNKNYKVEHSQIWTCSCPDFQNRGLKFGIECKHIHAMKFFLKLKNSTEQDTLDFFEELELTNNKKQCVYCKSENIVSNGKRKTKSGIRQRFKCNNCNKRFTLEPLKNHLLNAKMLCLACDLLFKGNSLRDIQDTLKQSFGIKINHETIRQNILKFTNKMNEYTNKLEPELGKNWSVDEQKVKCKGKWKWMWNNVDKKTRYLIANTITKERSIKEARQVFKKSKENLNKNKKDDYFKDLTITTDGLHGYKKAIKDEFLTVKKNTVSHRPTTHPKVNKSENMVVERYHNQYREFDKIRRDFKTTKSLEQWSKGFRVYNNFIHENKGYHLQGLTPAQASGINILSRNKWLSLLEKSLENGCQKV